jgi:hypothetical protein
MPARTRGRLDLPLVGQPRDVRGGESGGVLAEQRHERLAEVTRRQSAQVEHWQDLGDLRRPPHVRRQDATHELASLALGVHPPVVHAGRTHRDRPRADSDASGAALAVADHQGVAIPVALGGVGLQVGGDLRFQGHEEHSACSLAGDLVEQRAPINLAVHHRFALDDLQHGRLLLPPACAGAAVDQPGGYVGGVTGSTIHNIRSYLRGGMLLNNRGSNTGNARSSTHHHAVATVGTRTRRISLA